MNKQEIKLNIPCHSDREKIVVALANSGYSVRIEKNSYVGQIATEHIVIFGLPSEYKE